MSGSQRGVFAQDREELGDFFKQLVQDFPPEFWAHLGRSLQELGKAMEVLAEHWRASSGTKNAWAELYEAFMDGHRRVGERPQSPVKGDGG